MKYLLVLILLLQTIVVIDGETPISCVTVGGIVWCN